MPRGRPKGSKNKTTLVKENLFEQQNIKNDVVVSDVQPVIENKRRNSDDKYKKCMLCKQPMYSGPHLVQLTSFTGKAYWWRNVPDVVQMCDSCSKQFSDFTESWLIKHGLEKRIEV